MRYRDQLRVWESNYGRSLGWDIELDGRVVGLLDEPHQEDMFWTSYRISSTTNDPELSTRLMSDEFWRGEQKRIVAKVEHLMKLCDALESALRRREDRAAKLAEAVVQEMVA